MKSRVTVALKLGALELELSPFPTTEADLRRSLKLVEGAKRNDGQDLMKNIAEHYAINTLIVDLLLRSATANHPDLIRDRVEEELDDSNLWDAIRALQELSRLHFEQMRLEMVVH